MLVNVEIQLMRNWRPRSRPTIGRIAVGETNPQHTVLFPGSAAMDTEQMLVTIDRATRISKNVIGFYASLTIDRVPIGDVRPGNVWWGPSDVPTGIVHFPDLTDHARFSGWHSLRLRWISDVEQ